MRHHRGVRAVQFLDNLKALIELSEDVHHRAGEQSMLRSLLELQTEEQEDIFFTLTQIKKPNSLPTLCSSLLTRTSSPSFI